MKKNTTGTRADGAKCAVVEIPLEGAQVSRAAEHAALVAALAVAAPLRPAMEVKKFRSCRGTDGLAYSGELWVDGRRAAIVTNSGSGGETSIDWAPSSGGKYQGGPLYDRVKRYADAIPEHPSFGHMMKSDVELVVSELFEEYEERRAIIRKCAKGVPFQAPTDAPGTWRIMTGAFTTVTRATIVKAHGPDVRFAHEEFLGEKPLDLPADADKWTTHALKGHMVLKGGSQGDRWQGYKSKDTAETRLLYRSRFGADIIFLSDVIAVARAAARKAA